MADVPKKTEKTPEEIARERAIAHEQHGLRNLMADLLYKPDVHVGLSSGRYYPTSQDARKEQSVQMTVPPNAGEVLKKAYVEYAKWLTRSRKKHARYVGPIIPMAVIYGREAHYFDANDPRTYTPEQLALMQALERQGPLPFDPRQPHTEKSGFILSGMDQYDVGLKAYENYPYGTADNAVIDGPTDDEMINSRMGGLMVKKEKNMDALNRYFNGRAIFEICCGSGEKLTKIVRGVYERGGTIPKIFLNDIVMSNIITAVRSLTNAGYPKEDIIVAAGDIFETRTWTPVALWHEENKKLCKENGTEVTKFSALMLGVTINDYDTAKRKFILQRAHYLGKNPYFIISMDYTQSQALLHGAYNNHIFKQITLTGFVHAHYEMGIKVDPRHLDCRVDIGIEKDGSTGVRAIIINNGPEIKIKPRFDEASNEVFNRKNVYLPRGEISFEPIRKIDPNQARRDHDDWWRHVSHLEYDSKKFRALNVGLTILEGTDAAKFKRPVLIGPAF